MMPERPRGEPGMEEVSVSSLNWTRRRQTIQEAGCGYTGVLYTDSAMNP